MSNIVVLSDRIKELSHTQGQGAFTLDGKIAGFSPFGDFYEYGDAVFYAATDGTYYEVGSGEYILDGSTNKLTRYPLRSSALNSGPYYVNGDSSSGGTEGKTGYFHPLFLTKSAALGVAGATSVHTHTFSGYPGQTFYMPSNHAGHAETAFHGGTSGVDYNASGLPFNFPDYGIKEVYVTYPGKYSVHTGFGISDFKEPRDGGVAVWGSENILNYDAEIVWSDTSNALGINKSNPSFAIDIGGDIGYSQLRASGFFGGGSGVFFSGGLALPQDNTKTASGGRQLEPFYRNEIDTTTGTNGVFFLSGLVDERLCSHTQAKGTIFAGPASGCGCDPEVPTFRFLTLDDIPDLSSLYVIQDTGIGIDANSIPAGSVALYKESGVITYDTDHALFFNRSSNRLGINNTDPRATLDVVGNAHVSGDVLVSGDAVFGQDVTVSGDLFVKGTTTFIDSTNVTIHDKQLELASLSGDPTHDDIDSLVDDGGILVRSSGNGDVDTGDKKWTWRDSSNTWRSATSNGENLGITTSGLIFNDSSSISGAYHMGSGLTLHDNIEINVGNLFQASGSDHNTAYIHQNGILHVSGVSGIATELIPLADGGARIIINPHELSGVLSAVSNYDHWKLTDGLANSEEISSSEMVTISGVSGVRTHFDAASQTLTINPSGLSGVFQHALDNSTSYSWSITDGLEPADTVTGGETVTISGVSGIFTNYNSATNTLELSASGLSGVLRYDIDNSAGSYGWNFTDGKNPVDPISSADTLTVSGVSGILTHYDPTSNTLNLNPSGLSGVLTNLTAEQSGVFRHDIDNINLGNIDAGSGLTKVDSTIHMDVHGSGQLNHLAFDNNEVRIGSGVFDNAQTSLSGVGIGVNAGAVSHLKNSIAIGLNAASGSVDVPRYETTSSIKTGLAGRRLVVMGSQAAVSSSGSTDMIAIGTKAGIRSSYNDDSVMIGRDAGADFYANMAIGDSIRPALDNTNSTTSSVYNLIDHTKPSVIAIGVQAASGAYGYNSLSSDGLADRDSGTIAIGKRAMALASGDGVVHAIAIGIDAASLSWQMRDAIAIGRRSLYEASGCRETIAIGENAGRELQSHSANPSPVQSIIIGNSALRNNFGGNTTEGVIAIGKESMMCDVNLIPHSDNSSPNLYNNAGTVSIGYQAGLYSTGFSSVMIGQRAGAGLSTLLSHNGQSINIGEEAGYAAANFDAINIGKDSGWGSSGVQRVGDHGGGHVDTDNRGCQHSATSIGNVAGWRTYNQHRSIMIGYAAGAYSNGREAGRNVIIGNFAGYKLDSSRSIFIGGELAGAFPASNSYWSWTFGQDNVTKISNHITAKDSHVTLGEAPQSLAQATEAVLSVRSETPTIPSVKLNRAIGQSADQLQAETELTWLGYTGPFNTIVNRHGFLQVPVARGLLNGELYTHPTTLNSSTKIEKREGVMVPYVEFGPGNRYWCVCIETSSTLAWYRTELLTQLS